MPTCATRNLGWFVQSMTLSATSVLKQMQLSNRINSFPLRIVPAPAPKKRFEKSIIWLTCPIVKYAPAVKWSHGEKKSWII